jgi:PPOX class probable F420-dependent enzyme
VAFEGAGAEDAQVHLDAADALARAAGGDHGVLATLGPTGAADLVPVCFAIDGDCVAIPVDSIKPKRSTALGRMRNLERDPRATLLVERWDAADWSRLWWVRVSLVRREVGADVVGRLETRLRDRYPQYRADGALVSILTFRIDRIVGWEAVD